MVCQLFNESVNELGLHSYPILKPVETCQALGALQSYQTKGLRSSAPCSRDTSAKRPRRESNSDVIA